MMMLLLLLFLLQSISSQPTKEAYGVKLQGKMDIGNDLASIFQNILRTYLNEDTNTDNDKSEINLNKFISSVHDFVNNNPQDKNYGKKYKDLASVRELNDKVQIVNFNLNLDDPNNFKLDKNGKKSRHHKHKSKKSKRKAKRHHNKKDKHSKYNDEENIIEENGKPIIREVENKAVKEKAKEKTVLEEIIGMHDSVHIYGKHKGKQEGLPINNIKV